MKKTIGTGRSENPTEFATPTTVREFLALQEPVVLMVSRARRGMLALSDLKALKARLDKMVVRENREKILRMASSAPHSVTPARRSR
jgi:hypothetical protein